MRSLVQAMVAMGCLFVCGHVHAQDRTEKKIGSWYQGVEADPFEQGKSKAIVAINKDGTGLAVRCFSGSLSVILLVSDREGKIPPGTEVPYKFRADQNAVIEGDGEAYGQSSIELKSPGTLVKSISEAKTVAFRFTLPDHSIQTVIYKPTKTKEALKPIFDSCKEEIDKG